MLAVWSVGDAATRWLLRPCPQAAVTGALAQALKRIRAGLHPTTHLRGSRTDGSRPVPLRAAQEGREAWSASLRTASTRHTSETEAWAGEALKLANSSSNTQKHMPPAHRERASPRQVYAEMNAHYAKAQSGSNCAHNEFAWTRQAPLRVCAATSADAVRPREHKQRNVDQAWSLPHQRARSASTSTELVTVQGSGDDTPRFGERYAA